MSKMQLVQFIFKLIGSREIGIIEIQQFIAIQKDFLGLSIFIAWLCSDILRLDMVYPS